MKKTFYIFPLALLSLGGIILNTVYYLRYFQDANYGYRLSLSMSIFFIFFESALWIYISKKWWIIVLKFSMVIFSILITLSSQFSSTSEKESYTAEIVFEKTDISGDVDYYREQISILNKRIDEYVAQQLVFGVLRNKDALEQAKIEKARYESKLDNSQVKKEDDIKIINSPKSIYNWFAEDLPRIMKSGVNENLIRVLFQLFSSFILALMSPISLSMIKNHGIIRKPAAIAPNKSEVKLPKKIEKIVTAPPVKQKSEVLLSSMDKKNILKMLLFRFDEIGLILQPEDAVEKFISVNKDRPEIRAYTLPECKLVYGELTGKTIAGKNKDKIIKELMG